MMAPLLTRIWPNRLLSTTATDEADRMTSVIPPSRYSSPNRPIAGEAHRMMPIDGTTTTAMLTARLRPKSRRYELGSIVPCRLLGIGRMTGENEARGNDD